MDTPAVDWSDRSIILGSVAAPPFRNLGNRLIHAATLKLLGLRQDTPCFSLFQPMTPKRADYINSFDLVVFTGCTILEGSKGHQAFFNAHCERIETPKMLCAGAYCCEPVDEPGLDLARWFDGPLGARDPWTHEYLSRHGIESVLVGCPTLFSAPTLFETDSVHQITAMSASPALQADAFSPFASNTIKWVRHEPDDPGEDIDSDTLFDDVGAVVTGRLHLALPAIARGLAVRFFGPNYWMNANAGRAAGSTRFSLLEHLGVPTNGRETQVHTDIALSSLADGWRRFLQAWR